MLRTSAGRVKQKAYELLARPTGSRVRSVTWLNPTPESIRRRTGAEHDKRLTPSPGYSWERAGERGSREAKSRCKNEMRAFGPAPLPIPLPGVPGRGNHARIAIRCRVWADGLTGTLSFRWPDAARRRNPSSHLHRFRIDLKNRDGRNPDFRQSHRRPGPRPADCQSLGETIDGRGICRPDDAETPGHAGAR